MHIFSLYYYFSGVISCWWRTSCSIFGDSVVDVGNNNNLQTLIKADFLPYERDYITHAPIGRFCNGKLAIDFIADNLGFSSYPPAYLSEEATRGDRILSGVNLASAASAYYETTAQLYVKGCNIDAAAAKLQGMAEQSSEDAIFSGGIHLQNLYKLGARRIGVTSLPPVGCLPVEITLFGRGSNECVARLNKDAILFNQKLNSASQNLKASLYGLKLVVLDIYQPLLDMITNPGDSGLFEARRACCGTGTVETSILCNSRSVGTCSNTTGYVFWDGFHPSEAANEILAQPLLQQGFELISLFTLYSPNPIIIFSLALLNNTINLSYHYMIASTMRYSKATAVTHL
ncbi:hypothetical protein SASPL_108608 [Salvia splendens]|uniref:Zeta-carotene desaturase n=1 Tax=Salvia splendens TaxID=180675 RepID=A0A8X8YDF6_SALSN|nr:hypothetical protein SASPL_108608 [Salvia splendens]